MTPDALRDEVGRRMRQASDHVCDKCTQTFNMPCSLKTNDAVSVAVEMLREERHQTQTLADEKCKWFYLRAIAAESDLREERKARGHVERCRCHPRWLQPGRVSCHVYLNCREDHFNENYIDPRCENPK